MIKFIQLRDNYFSRDGECADPAKIVVLSDAESMSNLLEDFKAFALAAGYHPDTVKKIQMVDKEESDEEDIGGGKWRVR